MQVHIKTMELTFEQIIYILANCGISKKLLQFSHEMNNKVLK